MRFLPKVEERKIFASVERAESTVRQGNVTAMWIPAAIGLVLTAAVSAVPGLRFAYENPSLHVALETTVGIVAGLLALVAVGRFRSRCDQRDLLLAWCFTLLSVTSLVVSAIPFAALEARPDGFAVWVALSLRLAGGAAFAAAAFAKARRLVWNRELARLVGLASATVVVVAVIAAAAAASAFSIGIDEELSPASSTRPLIVGHPLLVGGQLCNALLYSAAAVGFARASARKGDDFLRWMASAAALNAVARVNYFLFPSLYSEWVYVGDLLRAGVYALFLVGALREVQAYWREHERLVAYEERARLARGLHDGLSQELAFIRSQTSGAAANDYDVPAPRAKLIAEAATRAIAESRRLVAAAAPQQVPDRIDEGHNNNGTIADDP